MIDTDKYEGHTPGPWMWYRDDGDVDLVVANDQCHTVLEEVKALYSEGNENLIADAPLLLEEVKRLRSLDDLLRSMEKDGITASGYDHLLAEVKRLREDNEKLHDAINRSFHAKISGSALEIYNGWWEGEEE